MYDLNDSGCQVLRSLEAMNKSGVQLVRTILSHDPMSLNLMNNLGLQMTLTTLGYELKALDYEQLKVMVDMNDFGL